MAEFEEREEIRKEEVEPDLSVVYTGSQALARAPELYGVATGIEGLDDLFFIVKQVGKKLEKVSLKGIPAYSVMNLTGVSDTGKSLMAEQFAVFRANRGDKVAFITVESPANFVSASLKLRAMAMGLDFDQFQGNIILIDAASSTRIRENLPDLLATLAYVIKNYKVKFTVIDSVTGLFENKEMMARAEVARALDIPWAYAVLKHLRGVKFPIQDSQVLKERLKGVKIKTHPAEEVVDRLPYPIKTPAVLLHEIKLAISMLEEQR